MTDGIRVTPKDATSAGVCIAGAKAWARGNRVDFVQFLTEGIPVEEIRALDCPLGNRVCDAAEKRAAERGAE